MVVGFAAAGYEINHLRTEFNGLHSQVQTLAEAVSRLYAALQALTSRTP